MAFNWVIFRVLNLYVISLIFTVLFKSIRSPQLRNHAENQETLLVNVTLSFSSLSQPFSMACIVSSLSLAVLLEFHSHGFVGHSLLCYCRLALSSRSTEGSSLKPWFCVEFAFWKALKPAGRHNMSLWQRWCDSDQAGEGNLQELPHSGVYILEFKVFSWKQNIYVLCNSMKTMEKKK